jgi:hypothetical protein
MKYMVFLQQDLKHQLWEKGSSENDIDLILGASVATRFGLQSWRKKGLEVEQS